MNVDPAKTLYVQEQWDDKGDMVFSGWNPNLALGYITYDHQAIITHAHQHNLTIRWLT